MIKHSATNPIALETTQIWLAEGQSSQRDMLLSLQQLKSCFPLSTIASHRYTRPEILSCADHVYQEPNHIPDSDKGHNAHAPNRVNFVLNHAIQHQVKVLLTGRNSRDYETRRADFEAAGIRLLTGATQVTTLDLINDKFAFSQYCESVEIPVASGWRFDNLEQLQALLEQYQHLPLCVKPIYGIFAQGFWRLDTGKITVTDSFEHLYNTDDKKIHLPEFVHAYAHSLLVQQKPIPMLLMPYLSGQEYSIDVVCEQGEVLAAVTRYKKNSIQYVGYDETVMDLVQRVIRALGCDGIVSVQTKADSQGCHHVLEINSRPSGGIGYTSHAFSSGTFDLTQVAFLYFAKLIQRPKLAAFRDTIIPCTVRSLMTSVKIDQD